MHILIVKTSSLGDIVYSLPIVSDILNAIPDASIDWLVEKNFMDLVRLHPGVKRIIPIHWRYWRHHLFKKSTWASMREHIGVLREKEYDIVIDTQELIKSAVMTRLARAKCICGHNYPKESMAKYAYHQRYSIPKEIHVIDRHRWLCSAIFGYEQPEQCHFNLAMTSPMPKGINTLLKQHPQAKGYAVMIHIASTPTKYWPETKWREVLTWCQAQQLICLLPWGSSEEQARAEALATDMPLAHSTPYLTIPEWATLLSQATVVIGQDTGFTHLSAALGRPTIALFVKNVITTHGTYQHPEEKRIISLGGTYCPTSTEVISTLKRWSLV